MNIKTTPWTPCHIGDVTLAHRIVLAPLTRARATRSALNPSTYVPNDIMVEYYEQRATAGGLIISEAAPVSLRASGFSGVPGWFTSEQKSAWSVVISRVHRKNGFFFTQLWHQGRTTHSAFSGQRPESSSDIRIEGDISWSGFPITPYETPRAMTIEDVVATQQDFVDSAKAAREMGCDGIEIHAGNGYLFDQFHHSNINRRSDEYGGTLEKRCKFTLETVDKVCAAIGSGRVAVRLSPFGIFNQTFGEQRVEQWTYLCSELGKRNLAYVHMIEPRFDEFKNAGEKAAWLSEMALEGASLQPFRRALGSTILLSAGGFGPDNLAAGIQNGSHDMVAFGRYFIANPDLVSRLRNGEPLYKWDRTRFYGPFEDNEIGYTIFPKRKFASARDRLKAQLED